MATNERAERDGQTLSGLAARLVWLAAGPMAIAVTAAHIAVNMSGAYGWTDVAYFGVLVVTVVAKIVDVAVLGGTSADGGPTTMVHALRFGALTTIASLALWAAAHWLGALAF